MTDLWTNIRGIRVAQQLSFSNKSVAHGEFLEKNLQAGFMGAGKKKSWRRLQGWWERDEKEASSHHAFITPVPVDALRGGEL